MGDYTNVTIPVSSGFVDQLMEISGRFHLEGVPEDQILGYLIMILIGGYKDALLTWEKYLTNLEEMKYVKSISDEIDIPVGEVILMCVKYAINKWSEEDSD